MRQARFQPRRAHFGKSSFYVKIVVPRKITQHGVACYIDRRIASAERGERCRGIRHILRRAFDIDADADNHPFTCGFDQNTGDFVIVHQNVIRPFQLRTFIPAKRVDTIGDGKRGDKG